MKSNARRGLQSPATNQSTDSEIIDAELDLDLAEAIEALERVDWHRVPGVSAKTAATFTLELERARDDVLGGSR